MQRHRLGNFRCRGLGRVEICPIDGIALRRDRHVDRGLRQRGVPFRHAHEVHRVLCGDRDRQRLRIRVADVLRRESHQPARDVERILAGFEHARQPVDGGVGIAVAHGLVQRGDQVVVLFAGLVVEQRAVLREVGDQGGVSMRRARAGRASPRSRGSSAPRARRRWRTSRSRPAPRRPRASFSRCRARARRPPARAAGSRRCRRGPSGLSTWTFDRDSSAEFTSNEGFSVVAPIRTMSPASTRGRKASCCALLKRWISSMNRSVRAPPRRRASSASAITARISLIPESTALNATNRACVAVAISRASVVLPVPGGPQRMIDCSRSCSIAARSGRPGPIERLLADELVQRARPHALGQRRRSDRPRCSAAAGPDHRTATWPSGWTLRTGRAPPRPRHSATRPAAASGW